MRSDTSFRPVPRDILAVGWLLLACGQPPAPDVRPAAPPAPAPAPAGDDAEEAARQAELAHRVVFADRITYSYLLLLPGDPAAAPTRADLGGLVDAAFAGHLDDEEVVLLRDLIATPPKPDDAADPARRTADLLGLEVEAYPAAPASGPRLVEPKVLADPTLTRDLDEAERASLPGRTALLVLRAHYRNQHALRGLRLLQTLVRVAANARGALIHDPDTLETVGPAVFTARRLQTSLGNVAEQIPVVPFPDAERPGMVRLATRGMRRFGSVDLELGGLPNELPRLEQGTYFLHGLARSMIELGEYDRAGFAVELPEILTLHHSDCASAYAGQPGSLPRCGDCPESAELHLVERAPEPIDAVAHVVARVVAPRPRSDRPDYDHPAWVREALDRVFGPPAAAPR